MEEESAPVEEEDSLDEVLVEEVGKMPVQKERGVDEVAVQEDIREDLAVIEPGGVDTAALRCQLKVDGEVSCPKEVQMLLLL